MSTYLYQFPYGNIFTTTGLLWLIYMGFYLLKHKSCVSLKRLIASGLSILYIVLFLTLFVIPSSFRPAKEGPYIILQLVPFHTIKYSNYISTFGNLIMLIFLPIILYLNLGSLKKICIFAGLIPVMIEPVQFIIDWLTRFPNFVVDIDDFILQLSGSIIGLFFVISFRHISQNRCK